MCNCFLCVYLCVGCEGECGQKDSRRGEWMWCKRCASYYTLFQLTTLSDSDEMCLKSASSSWLYTENPVDAVIREDTDVVVLQMSYQTQIYSITCTKGALKASLSTLTPAPLNSSITQLHSIFESTPVNKIKCSSSMRNAEVKILPQDFQTVTQS